MLGNFAPKELSFEAKLKDGRTVELFLRPYCLADMARSQDTFTTEKDRLAIANLNVDPCAKLIWHQLKSESKKIFMEFDFIKEDDDGNEIKIKPEGYERFIEGISDLDSLLAGYSAFAKSVEVNGFLPDDGKKKTMSK